MALNFIATEKTDLTPRITVFGVGGAGGNAVNNMIEQNLEGVEFVVANTDAQALQQSKARSRIQLGVKVTEGLGAGARPTVGASAAEETLEEIIDHLAGAHMCFITAGMGGGTGTGAAPIIAQAARELGVLTVGVVTKPFAFEGSKRMRQAEEGVEALQKVVDTLIIIPNQNLFRLANERTTFTEAFALADDVLYQGVKGVTDLMVRPGMINLDFADVRAVMDEMGKAMMGTGEASGEDRARQAAEKAIANPLLDEISLNGARGVLINITGGTDLTLYELDEAANLIREKVDPEANIIVGSTLDPTMEGAIRVSVVATGIEAAHDAKSMDVQRRRLAEPLAAQPQFIEDEPEAVAEPEHDYGYDDQGYEAAEYETPAFEPQVANTARRDQYAEPRAAVAQAEPRQEARGDGPRYALRAEQRFEARPEVQAPVHQPQAEQRQPYRAPEPAAMQDEFDLDDVLGAQAAAPRPTVLVSGQRQPAPAQQPAQPPQQTYEEATAFTAPSRERTTGQPSPATLARLRQAVLKQPDVDGQPRAEAYQDPRQAGHHEQRPYQTQHAEPQQERPLRSRLGGLFERMSGAHPEPQHAARVQPPVHSYDTEPQQRASQDRIEIPAFLRRQAN